MTVTHLFPLSQGTLDDFEVGDIAQIILDGLVGMSGGIRSSIVAIEALGSFTRRAHGITRIWDMMRCVRV